MTYSDARRKVGNAGGTTEGKDQSQEKEATAGRETATQRRNPAIPHSRMDRPGRAGGGQTISCLREERMEQSAEGLPTPASRRGFLRPRFPRDRSHTRSRFPARPSRTPSTIDDAETNASSARVNRNRASIGEDRYAKGEKKSKTTRVTVIHPEVARAPYESPTAAAGPWASLAMRTRHAQD